jgi:hypothetical protein
MAKKSTKQPSFQLQPGDIVFRPRVENGNLAVRTPLDDEWYFVEITQPNFTKHRPQERMQWMTRHEFQIYDYFEIPH